MKNSIIIIFIFSLFASCRKDTLYNPQNSAGNNSSQILVSLKDNDIVSASFSEFPMLNLCSGETWKALSGTVVMKLTLERSLKVVSITGFSCQDAKGKIYQGEGIANAELMWTNGSAKSYKISLKHNNNSSITFFAMATLSKEQNGRYQILIDSGALDCH